MFIAGRFTVVFDDDFVRCLVLVVVLVVLVMLGMQLVALCLCSAERLGWYPFCIVFPFKDSPVLFAYLYGVFYGVFPPC